MRTETHMPTRVDSAVQGLMFVPDATHAATAEACQESKAPTERAVS